MAFHNSIRKLKHVQKSLKQQQLQSDKYVSKYDALSLSIIETDALSNPIDDSIHLPRMDGLRKLVHDLLDIFTEGCIEQQMLLSNVRKEIEEANVSTKQVLSSLESHSNEGFSGNKDPTNALSFDELAVMTRNLYNVQLSSQARTLELQIKPILSNLYNRLNSMIDSKLEILQCTMQITDQYTASVLELAREHGVLEPMKKSQHVIGPHVQPLMNHKFFDTKEEEALLGVIRRTWSSLVFHCGDHSLLADRQLASEYYYGGREDSISSNGKWMFYLKGGGIAVLLLWAVSECFNNEATEREIWNDQTFLIFMCFGDLLLLLLMWGVSINVWRVVGIDYIRLLELEETEIAQQRRPDSVIYDSTANLCILFLSSFILFNKAVRGGYFAHSNLSLAHAIPAILVLFFTVRILHPFHTRRRWLFMLMRVILAPSYSIIFRDGYIGDLLTSLVRVFVPLVFSFLYVIITAYAWLSNDIALTEVRSDSWWTESTLYKRFLVPFVTLLPLWLRLQQCLRRSVESGKRWPHVFNALKYASAIIVISYGTFQPALRHNSLWVTAFVFTTLYQFAWDLTQDWGLFVLIPPRVPTPIALSSGIGCVDYIVGCQVVFRKTRLLGPIGVYIVIIVMNFLLRFTWALTLLPVPIDVEGVHTLYVSLVNHISPLLASLEIIRRMVWGFLRLEHEQLETLSRAEDAKEALEKDGDKEMAFEKVGWVIRCNRWSVLQSSI